jgi:SAM-dependent methyltransferase
VNLDLGSFLDLAESCGADRSRVEIAARESVAYHRRPASGRNRDGLSLERRWYDAIAAGEPDYGVYGDDGYLGDLWACWEIYSRRYLRSLATPSALPPDGIVGRLRGVDRIVDLGCGCGFTTARLAELFPEARDVVGTNLPEIVQTKMAEKLAAETARVRIVATLNEAGKADLAFASEYFEHFNRPVEHLAEVVNAVEPRYLLVANTFASHSIGHFDRYLVGGVFLDGRATARKFGDALRRLGYRKVETRLWNNRPALWEAAA